MNANFQKSLKHILKYEGGYTDHRLDPGGATNLGITQRVLSAWRGHKVTKSEVQSLSIDEAGKIYKARYWDKCHCDDLPDGLDFAVFDCAVNQGVGRATRFLQQAISVTADGVIGPITLRAARSASEAELTEFMARRMRGYGILKSLFPTFGLGWSRRLMFAHAEALNMYRTRGSCGV